VAQRDIGCEDCGAVMPMQISAINLDKPNVWYPGKKCPMCGSEKFLPVIAITDTDREAERPTSFKRRLLVNPWTGIAAIAVTMVVVLGVMFWPHHRRDTGEKVLFYCEKCDKVFYGRKAATPPVKCPTCHQRTGYRAGACDKCSLVYSREHKRCPHCGNEYRRVLNTPEEAAQARKQHQEYLRQEKEAENDEHAQ
jgi:RNA polymerase subunit RPABC4/transcription elongation factor Spt4